jgi:acetolactate synthase I/II/III large subunit
MKIKGTDFILRALHKEGIRHIFMVPGGLIDPFLPAFARVPGVKPVVAAMEAGAAYMADGYARASGNFGACLAIGGPGVTNMTTAISAAWTDGSPIFVISGEVPSVMEGLGEFQDASASSYDDVAIFKTITGLSIGIENHHLLNHIFHHAVISMFSLRHRPVHLSIPVDIQENEVSAEYQPVSESIRRPRILDANAADQVWKRIAANGTFTHNVSRLAVLAGAGIEHSESSERLLWFAERFRIPVATTLRAKGVFPEDHPLSLGVFGYAGTRHATEAILCNELELLLVLGSSLQGRDSMHWSQKLSPIRGIVTVNILNEGLDSRYPGGLSVTGDAGAFLDHIMEAAPEHLTELENGKEERSAWVASIKDSYERFYDAENCCSDTVPIHPARVITELRRVMPRDTICLVDSGAHRAFCGHYWESYGPREYVSATTIGPMGWAIPASIGVKLARPDKPCVVVTGDGCMLMHGIEVQTAGRYNIPVMFVVINNAALGNVWLRTSKIGELPGELVTLPDHDWAGFARSLGVAAVTVVKPDELQGAFLQALSADRPFLIDVKADRKYATPVEPYRTALTAWAYHE